MRSTYPIVRKSACRRYSWLLVSLLGCLFCERRALSAESKEWHECSDIVYYHRTTDIKDAACDAIDDFCATKYLKADHKCSQNDQAKKACESEKETVVAQFHNWERKAVDVGNRVFGMINPCFIAYEHIAGKKCGRAKMCSYVFSQPGITAIETKKKQLHDANLQHDFNNTEIGMIKALMPSDQNGVLKENGQIMALGEYLDGAVPIVQFRFWRKKSDWKEPVGSRTFTWDVASTSRDLLGKVAFQIALGTRIDELLVKKVKVEITCKDGDVRTTGSVITSQQCKNGNVTILDVPVDRPMVVQAQSRWFYREKYYSTDILKEESSSETPIKLDFSKSTNDRRYGFIPSVVGLLSIVGGAISWYYDDKCMVTTGYSCAGRNNTKLLTGGLMLGGNLLAITGIFLFVPWKSF
jgi:hypothetical protein